MTFRILLVVLAVGAIALPSGGLSAQVAAPGVVRRDSVAEFDFQDVELRVVLAALAEAAGVNTLFSNIPSRTVTLRTSRPVTVAEVRAYMETLARANGITMVDEGGLIRISGPEPRPAGAAGVGAARADTDQSRLFVYPLRHAQADALAQTLAAIFSLAGAATPTESEGSGALSDELRSQRLPPDYMPEPPAPPARPGTQPIVRPGASVPAGLRGPVHVVADARTNSLLVRAMAADYDVIRAAVQQLDTRPLQVLIEVLIAEVRRDRQFAFGTSVSVPDSRIGEGGTTVGGSLTGVSAGDLAIRILDIGGVKADVVLRTLAQNADVTILSRPVVLAQNNQEARILVGSERPFIQLFRALPTDAAVRDQVVQYRDVGTQLTIRPTINPDSYVSMSVLQEVSTATAETQFGAPIISTREAKTQLLVKDNETAVIGGLIDHQRERTESGIPFLKDIPVLGALFRSSQTKRKGATELFIFITPHVLKNDRDMEDATRQLREGTTHLREEVTLPIPLIGPVAAPRP